MAKKPRTPPPPRSVQAPQRRDTRSSGFQLSALPRWVWAAAAGLIIVIVVAVVAVGMGGGSGNSSSDVKAAMLAAGCTYRDVKPLPPKKDPTNYHADVPSLTTPTKGLWSTSPPSGGAHYGLWAIWGFYRTTVNPRQVVHNEEHGGVIIWWGPKVASSTVDQLEAFYNQQTDGVFGTPYAGLGNKIALTAWTGNPSTYYVKGDFGTGHIAVCPTFNQKAFAAFRSAYRGKGPEGIPLSVDKPGLGPNNS